MSTGTPRPTASRTRSRRRGDEMEKGERFIRIAELGFALASTYMAAVTMLQTTLYRRVVYFLGGYLWPFFGSFPTYQTYMGVGLIVLTVTLSFLSWRRGDEAGFARIFTVNMLMFFPSVVDFSTFNWVSLILDYEPTPGVTSLWVFIVGLLLQVTYLFLRYSARIRGTRGELLGRGADEDDLIRISKGQMTYLVALTGGTGAIIGGVYLAIPQIGRMLATEVADIPYPQVIIGIASTLLIAGSTILYLRGGGRKRTREPDVQEEEEPAEEPSEEGEPEI